MNIRAFTVGVAVFLSVGAMFFAPSFSQRTAAYPENLYTSNGQWKQRTSRPDAMFKAVRTEHGWPYSWLVVDRSIEEPAWYAKMHEGLVCIYVGLSFFLGGAAFLLVQRVGEKKRPDGKT